MMAEQAPRFAERLLDGIADVLRAADVVADGLGPFRTSEVGIYYRRQPPEGSAVTMAIYNTIDDPTHARATYFIQIRARHKEQTDNGLATYALADDVNEALHGLYQYDTTTGIRLTKTRRLSLVDLGRTEDGRWTVAQNFEFTVYKPGPRRR